uniref:non-specific serine/threonine protein kinase n=1 Tax=Macrostomum lignano TaxID=282301 RepID=A0A1I8HAL2_9PLAT
MQTFIIFFKTKTPAPTHNNDLIFVSTIDGYFYAVEKYTGIIKWKIKEDPVVQVAFSDKSFLLPDPTNGNLYVVGSSDSDVAIKKLPYSIPELVSISPTRSSDGTFCTGFKRDFWLSVDSRSGMKTDVFSSDRGSQKCPNKANEFSTLPEDTAATGGTGGGGGSGGARYDQAGHSILIGRSQHTLVVYDRLSGAMIWNVTYNDYSAHSITEPDQERLNSGDPAELKYLTSSQSAYLAVVSAAIYSVASSQVAGDHHRSLVRQLYSPFGDEALRILVDSLRTQRQFPANIGRDSFQPSLFIGASGQHWYALSTYTLSTAKLKPPCRARTPLLEGPIESNPNSLPAIRDLTAAEIAGLYSPPELSKKSRLPIDKRLSDRSSPHGVIELSQGGSATVAAPQQQDLKLIAISVLATLLAVLVPFIVWQWHRTIQALNDSQRGSGGGSADAGPAGSGGASRLGGCVRRWRINWRFTSGWRQIGNISYDPRYVLGRGCEGTLVYKGRFDDREVAVKRMLPDCFSVADKEVQLLRLSDQHLNVVRYYCTEQDAHFRYIALELCDATVVDYAKEANPADRFGLEPSSVLHQALQGLHHLHNLDIVHRDVKPTNLLLCKNAGTGVYRTVISDFGLCKRLSPGRVSFSKRSGLTGTEGWIAPEMFESESTSATCAVDVFSVGCVCYYVLSRGKHPFGDALNRQRNILDGNYSLSALRLDHLANDMIMKMIEHRPLDRLSIDGALKHPFFWSVDQQMHFLTEASDRTDKLPMDDPLMERMESCAPTVCGTDWSDRLDIQVYDNLVTFRGYRTHRLVDLLRAIRNKRNHFRELSPSVQLLLGRSTEEYVHYFTSRYPQLLTYLYNVLVAVKLEHSFERYYSSLDPDYFPKYYRAHMKQAYIKDSKLVQQPDCSEYRPATAAKRLLTEAFRRLIARRGRSSGGSDNVDVSRHASDSELVAGNVGPCGSGLPSLFRSPPMQRLQRKAELLKQQTTELETCAVAVGAVEPPGLSRSQENLLAVRQLSANWNRSAALIDSDADPSVIFSADSYSLFRIDSYPHGTQLPDNYCAQTAQTDDNNLDATHHQNEQQAEQQQLDQPEALLLKAKKKTRRGKKAKKSSASNASASVNSMIGADGDQDEPDILLDF